MRIPILLSLLLPLLAGCANTARHLDKLAASAGLHQLTVNDGAFPARLYVKRSGPDTHALLVFIEGDGIPWRGGRVPATDPTSSRALALHLLIDSRAPGLYVTRPCYQRLHSEHCNFQLWTAERYSATVVQSMVQTIAAARQRLGMREVILVGYSGGGTLAVLIAERLDAVAGVLTLGANLDVQAWTTHHGYLPLSGSLDPSRSQHAHHWPELHLQGGRDTQVPPASTNAYFQRYPQAHRELLPDVDHDCCWEARWPALLELAERYLPMDARTANAVSGKSENTPSTPRP